MEFGGELSGKPPAARLAMGRACWLSSERVAMARDGTDLTPIASRDELVAWIAGGAKPPGQFRIGTEHEKIPFFRSGRSPVPYEGLPARGQGGIRALLEGMQKRLGWAPVNDRAHIIGLFDATSGAGISLEPGGQFELSGAPLDTIHETNAELDAHFAALEAVAAPLGIGFLALGMSPKWRLGETPMMPKQRYAIMVKYMPLVGARGLDMMFRTATVQANFDFSNEADMVKKLRVSLALQPVATALFANSPFTEGKLNGFLSARSEVWRATDKARTGTLPFAFEQGMSFERYVDYALSVPMYFVKRGEIYHDVAGADFRDFLQGGLAQLPGEQATLADWANHLTTIFPEVRLKRYLEMRGAQGPSFQHFRRFSRGSSTRRPRSTRPSISSRTGAPRRGKTCAMMFRASALRRRSTGGACARSRPKFCALPAWVSPNATGAMPGVSTKQCFSLPSMRSSRKAAKPSG
jgi:glutamate--cysteine ligase